MGVSYATHLTTKSLRFWMVAWVLLLVAYILGLLVFPMDIDSAQYAAMSMEMWQNQSFLEITNLGKPYLDKPPLIFWLSSISMGIFGFTPWAFKLPTFISTILGVYSTYRLAHRIWGLHAARNASLILASSVAWLIFTNDVRTDALLANFVIFSCWQFVEWYIVRKNIHLIAMAVGISLAMLSKGPIGAVAVGIWMFCWLILNGDWKVVFHVRWLIITISVVIILLPMCWGLYNQHGWDGIRFYFWTQSFGRVTGESEWVNHPELGYFVPVLAWSFLPWTPFFIWGLVNTRILKIPLSAAEKTLVISSLAIFVSLSLSRYKLPHYIFIILPWLAMLTARWIEQSENHIFKKVSLVFTWMLFGSISVAIPWFVFLFLPAIPVLFWISWVINVCLILYLITRWSDVSGILAVILAGVFVILNGWFYPHLLMYQGTSQIGRLARKKEISPEKIRVTMPFPAYALTFAYQHVLQESEPWVIYEELQQTDYLWIICDRPRRDYMQEIGIQIVEENQAVHYPVTRLKPVFINKNSREKNLQSIYLCKVTRKAHDEFY